MPFFNSSIHKITTSRCFCRARVSLSCDDGTAEEEGEEDERGPTSSCVIQDKDLLRKSTKSGLYVLDLLDSCALEPNATLYNQLFRKCTRFGKLREGRIAHAHFARSEFSQYLVVQNTVLNMYAKCGSLDEARKVFDEMVSRDMVSWTVLITGYAQSDRPSKALVLFPEMLRLGLQPNQFTFSSLLKAAGAVPNEGDGRQVQGVVIKCGFHSNVYVGSSLVDMYVRCGLIGEARFAFDSLTSKNEVSWNALIAGHARKGEGENAIGLFVKMQRESFRPTPFTYSSIFGACASTGALEQGKWVHTHMIKSGQELASFVGNTLLDMYAKSGSIEDAIKIFNRLRRRDVVSWNSMLTGCAQHGLGEETVQRFEQMLRVGIEPNAVTFLCVLTACSHAGLIDRGKYYFELMTKYKVEPDVSHYVTVVDLYGRAGQLDRAKEFIEGLPIEPTAAVWGALLGACRMHKNMELGAYAADRVFELDPHDSGPHVILYNMYASVGRLNDAARVKRMMRESGVKKEPACSWVEIENAVHVFMANDDAHPLREEIYKKWEEVNRKIKEIGYVPDASHVLFFADQEEREVKLQYHSEKLALSYALITTLPQSMIRIKKNIRVCGDCHSAFKFVSKVEEREIILRDKNRFHHFRNGICSCGDYW